jgi:hypothetical protein
MNRQFASHRPPARRRTLFAPGLTALAIVAALSPAHAGAYGEYWDGPQDQEYQSGASSAWPWGGSCYRQGVGSVLGGVLGGVLGAQVGKGGTKTAATVAGTLAGVLVGRELGRSMDTVDPSCSGQGRTPVPTTPTGTPLVWRNPDRIP